MPVCPLSDIPYHGRCPVTTCVFNVSGMSESLDCLRQSEYGELSYVSIKKFLQDYGGDVQGLDKAIASLTTMASEFHEVKEAKSEGACPGCGYVNPCKSTTICEERAESVAAVIGKLPAGVIEPHQVWIALVRQKTAFLKDEIVEPLKDLVSVRTTRA